MRVLMIFLLCAHLALPVWAQAQNMLREPLSYSLRDYGFVLAVSLLGGLVGWYSRLRAGKAEFSVLQLVGELCTSAFAGLLAFWLCEWANFPQLLTVALVGMAGHMGTTAIAHFEKFARAKLPGGAVDHKE